MESHNNLNLKERERFRKLLQVAESTKFSGEKKAALAAATRIANSKGLSLREAAGMEEKSRREDNLATRKKTDHSFDEFFVRKNKTNWSSFKSDLNDLYSEKQRFEKAKADAINRGLDSDETNKVRKKQAHYKSSRSNAWRSRPDFIRILLRETKMSLKEISATVGVPLHEVVKERLLMRKNR